MELGVFQASFSTSSCSVSRHDVLTDRFVLNEALIYQRLLPRCPKSSLYVEGGCKSLASRFKSYLAPSDQFKSLHKSGATVCHRENAEHKLQVQKKSWIERNISSSELRWALHDAEATNFMKIPSSARPAHGLESRWISLTENTRRKQVKGMVARCNHQSTLSGFTDLKDQLRVLATRPKINRELFPLRRCEVYYTRTTSNNLGLPEFSQYKGKINDGRTRAVALEAAVESNDSALPLSEVKPYAIGGGTRERPSKKSNTGASTVLSGVRLEHISKTFKGATVLKDVNWEVKKGEKVGLVGVNGAGKTTQLKIIAGDEEPDSGSVIKVKENMKISFLTQEFEVVLSRTVKEEFLSAFSEQMEILDRIEMIHKALESAGDNMTIMGKLLDELDGLQKQAEEVDLNSVDAKINKMMPELGFSQEDNDRLVASFSGGWQMRMSLGKIFLQDPDLLLLDEPTNHLDLDTIEWLENYLKKQDVPMVIVSHDRAFLDRLCSKIVETDMGVSCTFEGNYSNYVQAKAAWVEAQRMAWEKQQKEISRTKDIIQRLSGGANAGRASTAEKQLEKIQEEELVEKPFEQKQIKFRFPEMERSGRTVVVVKNMDLEYEDKVLFKNANLLVERGEKLAIIGPNGCGKSTLLRMIMGFEEPTSGEVYLGEHRVITNYFEQNQAEALDLEKSVTQTVEEAAEDWNMNDLRGLLGRCNFKGDMVLRKVALLSGGEKARLALCKFMVTPSTLLVLDEPTNHLDIPSKEMLEEAIRAYKGTVIAVSHDRYFLKQIVNRVVEVKDNILQDYAGDYNYYLEQNLEARRRELEREAELEAKATTIKAKSKMSKAEKELQKKQKAQTFQQNKAKGKIVKNAKRWN